MRVRCSPLCRKFHTRECPKEDGDEYFTKIGERPIEEFCFERRRGDVKINLYELAETILNESDIITEKKTYTMYRFDGKIWVDDVESYLQKVLVETELDVYRPYHLTTLVEIVQALTFVERFEEPPPNLICVKNGVIDVEKMELIPHGRNYFFKQMINAEYNPNAKCEKFLKWLEEVLPNEEDRKLIQEMFGYCFYRDYPYHKIFFLVGTGRNGKGTLIRTLEGLIGERAMVSIPLERLEERFQATNLFGKLVNVVSEPKISIFHTEMIKRLTGQDLITGEIKGKQKGLEFKSYAKIIVLANRLPPVRDDSKAWWDRVIVVEFPKEFTDNQIPNIEKQWLDSEEERSGILNWGLEGLRRLLKNGFTKSMRMEEIKELYQKLSRPVRYFFDKYLTVERNAFIPKKTLYELYKKVAEEEGLEIVNEEIFSRELRSIPGVTTTQKRIEGKVTWVWKGIALRGTQKEEKREEKKTSILDSSKDSSNSSNSSNSSPPLYPPNNNEEKSVINNNKEKSVTSVTSVTSSYILREMCENRTIDNELYDVKGRRAAMEKERLMEGGRESFRSIEGPVTLVTPVTPPEECRYCQLYSPSHELCTLKGEKTSPYDSCENFTLRKIVYWCSCGVGPWNEKRQAQEHIDLFSKDNFSKEHHQLEQGTFEQYKERVRK